MTGSAWLCDLLHLQIFPPVVLHVSKPGCWGFKLECGPPFGPATAPYAGKGSFRDLPNVKMTPNVMFQTEQFWDNSAAFVGANLKAFVEGRQLNPISIVRNITVY